MFFAKLLSLASMLISSTNVNNYCIDLFHIFKVHIQTIGILVGEKQELQSTVSQLQRKYDIKQSKLFTCVLLMFELMRVP